MNFLAGFLMIPTNLIQAIQAPDTWELIAAILSVAGPIFAKKFWTERNADIRQKVEKAANTAADLVIVLIERDLIPDDEKEIIRVWTERVSALLRYAGIKLDAKTEAIARSAALARIGQAALMHESKKLGEGARELGKAMDRLGYEFTNGLTTKVKK